ncbi:L,D-transpeptidase family protein [Sphingomonas sp. BIUV-7]|uniref:L,D-transpeptidase family protein n=1 Tax=Sphingomonas natans TaxID=3063330 RepID=A0ABT8Y3M5_9SPHN|nr:L,D-transpeptidase family protein [Sphingomonas sp. BIUV-7]MDO6412910.1 L,D-transpeptidase family protein [Sphingomonas sp. BIUV-7]
MAATGAPPSPETLRIQVLLDRLGFGPGVLDGHSGLSLAKALKGFQSANDLPESGKPDEATMKLLDTHKDVSATAEIVLNDSNLSGPFVGPIPKKESDQAKLPAMGYADPMEALAERYHTTPALLVSLNSPTTKLVMGAKIKVPNVVPGSGAYPEQLKPEWKATLASLSVSADQPKAAKLVVDKSDGVLRAYDDAGKLIAQFPVTTGSQHDPLPIGTWKVQGTSYLPPYHYNPKLFWDAGGNEKAAVLKPGPNGPVGVVWMDLDKPHYGIHGTPVPENIGRTASHGCIRLTNWDAARLSLMVKPGTPAVFQP